MIRPPHPRLHRSLLARLAGEVESHLGAPCQLRPADGDLLRATFVRRRLTRLDLAARDVPLGDLGARLSTLEVALHELELHGSRLRPHVRASAGSFVASLGEEAISDLVQLPPVVERVWFVGDGLRVHTVMGIAFTCEVRLEDGRIVVHPRVGEALAGRLPWRGLARPVPELPFGATLESLVVDGGEVVVTGSMDPARLRFPGQPDEVPNGP